MTKTLALVRALLKQPLALARKMWAKEPARVVSGTTAVVVFACAKLGVVAPAESVASALALALPLVLGGELIRAQVTPSASLPKPLTVKDLTPTCTTLKA